MPESEASSQTSVPTSQPKAIRKASWLALLLLLAASMAIRAYCLTCKPFWFDECFSVELARIGWANFLRLLWWREANMSFYYLLLRLWLHWGHSPFFIRSLSVVISALTVPAIYWLARLLYNGRVALLAAILLAFNAYDVRYAQEARSYSLFVLLTILSSACLVAWLQRPARSNWAAYVLSSILAAYAHFYALLLIVAQWLAMRHFQPLSGDGVLTRKSGNSLRSLRKGWIAMALGVAPLLIFVAKTGAGPIRWIHRPGLCELLAFFEHLAGGGWLLLSILAALCIAAVPPARRLWSVRDRTWEIWRAQFLLIWLLFPIVLTIFLSFVRPVFLARYMIFCLPPLLILAAAGLARLRHLWILTITLAAILLLASQGVLFVYGHDFDQERDGSGAASNFILDHTEPGDGVIFHIAATRVAYEFFRSLRAGENTASPDFTAQFGPEILYPNHAAGLDYRDFTGKPSAELLPSLIPGHPRIWVMLMDNGPVGKPDPSTIMLSEVLQQSFPKLQRWQFPLLELRLYSQQ